MNGLLNCWEFQECGRIEGGSKAHTLGVCPAATQKETDGIHGGKNGGRVCWAVAGTFCGGKPQGVFADKFKDCANCSFFDIVLKENNLEIMPANEILARLKAGESNPGK